MSRSNIKEQQKYYIGQHQAQVAHSRDPYSDIPQWYINKLSYAAKQEGMMLDDFMEKYRISGDPINDMDYNPYFDEDWGKDNTGEPEDDN